MALKDKLSKVLLNGSSSAIHFGSRWLVNVFLARTLGFASFGIYSYITALAALAASLFTYGSNTFLLHAYNKHRAIAFLVRGLRISTLLMLISLPILLVFQFSGFAPSEYKDYLFWAIIIGYGYAISAVLFSYFKGVQMYKTELKIQFYSVFAVIPLVVSIYLYGAAISTHLILGLFAFYALAPIWIIRKNLKTVFQNLNVKQTIGGIKNQVDYFLVEFQGILHLNIAFFILGSTASAEDLGLFRSIYILLMPFQMLVSITNQVLLTELSKIFIDTPKLFWKKQPKFLIPSFLFGLVFWVFFEFTYEILFGFINKFENETDLSKSFKVFSLFILVFALKSVVEVTLTAINKHNLRSKMQWIAIALMVFTFFILKGEPIYKMALSYLISNAFLLFSFSLFAVIQWRKWSKLPH
jgi:O-antigen/teichoic acid export membrane protein